MKTAEQRAALAEAKRRVAELLAPDREAARIARAKAGKERRKAIGKPAAGQRQPRVEEPNYLRWVRGLPCIACTIEGATPKATRCEAAHIRSGFIEAGWRPTGMAEKPDDRRTAPLCATHHREGPKAQHAANERAWWSALGIYPPSLCSALGAAYDDDQDGAAVIRAFAPRQPSRQSRGT